MWCQIRCKIIGLGLLLGTALTLRAQDTLSSIYASSNMLAKDTFQLLSQEQKTLMNKRPPKKRYTEYPFYVQLNYDFFTTLMGSFAKNPIDPSIDKDNIYFYYNVTLNNRLQLNKVRINTYFFNEFGKRFYIDSLGTISEDQYYFKNTINYSLIRNKLDVNFMVNVKSQFWKHYDYREDSVGIQQRYLYSSYYTPGYTLFSGGFTYDFWEGSTVELGLASGKITKIRNQNIWDERETDILYGIEKGTKTKTIFGINLQVNMLPKMFGKHFCWENYTQFFIPNEHFLDIKNCTLDFNNAVHFLFLKYMRISLRTEINYDITIQEKPQIINQFSVGFYLSNVIQ